jgi:hypothetical protein
VRDKFISQFFNPVLKFINKNTNNNFRLLEKKKYRENNKYKYYQTSDLVQTVDKLKKKWNEIEWALALKKLNSKGAIEFFESVFKITEKNKIKQSFPVIFNNFNDKYKNIDSLFYEYDCFQKQLQNYEDAYEIENLSLTR